MIPEPWLAGEVAVIGLGRSGTAAAGWLAGRGVRVYASDGADTPDLRSAAAPLRARGVAVELGGHDAERVARAAAVVVSPGVPFDIPAVEAARGAGVEVLAEVELALRQLPAVRFVAVTGTNGKTTTTALIHHLFVEAGLDAAAAGNIGRPLIEFAEEPATAPPWIILEVSSFQLHDAPSLAPAIGVLTNLAPDHLNRYPSAEAYYEDKRRLFRNATDRSIWVLNGDDPAVARLADGVPGAKRWWSRRRRADAWHDDAGDVLVLDGAPLLARTAFPLLGDHNVENGLAAALVCAAAGVGAAEIARGLASFRPLPHRLEPVGERAGVLWINDSKATNVASASAALRAMTGPFVLIAGGRDKGEDFSVLAPLIDERCRALVLYGEAAGGIAAALAGACAPVVVDTLEAAMDAAAARAHPGDVVLLSPACASFDQFASFEHRGRRFKELVEARP